LASISFIHAKKDSPTDPIILDFFVSQRFRGFDRFAATNGNKNFFSKEHKKIFPKNTSKELLALADNAQNFCEQKKNLFIDGKIFNSKELEDFEKNRFSQDTFSACKKLVSHARGEFAIAFFLDKKFFFLRDFLGSKPLWFGENSHYFAVSSEPRALKKVDINFSTPVPPGHILSFCKGKWFTKKLFDFSSLKTRKKTTQKMLFDTFIDSVNIRIPKSGKTAVFFSGGVDSSLIAKAVSEKAKKTVLFTVGTENSKDIIHAKKVAKEMALDLITVIPKKEEILESLLFSVSRMGFFDEMQAQIALPEFLCAKKISEEKIKTCFNGQGSDELFFGYSEYKKIFEEKGHAGTNQKMLFFLESMHSRNLYREDIVSSTFGLTNHSPFLDLEFVKKAVNFPAEKKMLSAQDETRKHPIREMAHKLGVSSIAFKRKKTAIQYGSGLNKYKKLLGM
jgi:asparagine synthase (glutamine-hydrolysing)